MPVQETENKNTFWRDFLSGLAGPASGAWRANRDASGKFTALLDEAKRDVVAGLEAAYSNVPAEQRADCVGNGSAVIRMVRSTFDAMASLARADQPERLRELYESVRALVGSYAESSVPFRELGRYLDRASAN